MSTASAEARAQCAARLRILHRPGRSPRTQRNPGDQDRCRAAQRADVPRPTGSERSENSRDDHVCSRSGSRASIGRIRRRTGSGRAASRCRQDFWINDLADVARSVRHQPAAVYTTKRVGGGVQDFDAIKVLKFRRARRRVPRAVQRATLHRRCGTPCFLPTKGRRLQRTASRALRRRQYSRASQRGRSKHRDPA